MVNKNVTKYTQKVKRYYLYVTQSILFLQREYDELFFNDAQRDFGKNGPFVKEKILFVIKGCRHVRHP